jgi:acetamidase/formamidase
VQHHDPAHDRLGVELLPLGVGALPHDFPQPYVHYFTFDDARTTAEFTRGIRLPMAPFLGVVAVEPAGSDPVSAILSGAYGGNLVLRDLTAGSHLFLPVAKSGARIWTGDVHALQGDGVVDQTAIETAAEDLAIRYDLHKNVALRGPLGETDTAWIVIGFGPVWAAEGPATLHLTLNPVIDSGDGQDEAVVHSVLLIIAPGAPITIRTAAAITQTLRRTGGTWRISRRTVAECR